MLRICPFCKSRLSLSDKFFCTRCGNTLPSDLISRELQKTKTVELVSSIVLDNTDKKQPGGNPLALVKNIRPKSWKLLIVAAFATTIPAIALFSFDKLIAKISINKISQNHENISVIESTQSGVSAATDNPVKKSPTNFSIVAQCNFSEGNIFNEGLSKNIPFDVDFYLETGDPKVISELINSEILANSNFIDFNKEFQNKIKGPVGFFFIKSADKSSYGIIAGGKDIQATTEDLEEYNAERLGDYILVVSDESIISDVAEVSLGLAKSLSLNPVYASAKSLMPGTGKALILPVTKIGKGYVYQLLDNKLSDSINSVVNSFIDSKLDYAVVL